MCGTKAYYVSNINLVFFIGETNRREQEDTGCILCFYNDGAKVKLAKPLGPPSASRHMCITEAEDNQYSLLRHPQER